MFHFLGFLFIIIVVILVVGLSIIGTVLRVFFGLGKRRNPSSTYQNCTDSPQPNSDNDNHRSDRTTASSSSHVHKRHKKLFAEDEGEYVDFEEIKE